MIARDTGQASLLRTLATTETTRRRGRVLETVGATLRVGGLDVRIGQQCEVVDREVGLRIPAEVIGVSQGVAVLAPLAPLHGVSTAAEVVPGPTMPTVPVGPALLGRVLDANGAPIDGGPPLGEGLARAPVFAPAPDPLRRRPVDQTFATGVRALDALVTVGVGQRVGVFAPAGVGKSTLLGMLARHGGSEVNVIALIGERGREVREFIEDALGAEGLRRSVIVVSTSERPAMERVRAAHAATAIAEGFRARGHQVLLMMDSVTRFARALREIGLAAGEPAVRRGFPPSVFAELPRLFERAGNDEHGSITAFYSVLLEDEDTSDPVGEEVRSILDGHVILSRALSKQGQFPAIDVLASLSRVFPRVAGEAHRAHAARLRTLLARHAEVEFLLQVGEYKAGSDPLADAAIARMPAIRALVAQRPDEGTPFAETLRGLAEIAG
ncbi:MAG: FliI/YscN family ATPase [Burkholderiales bacterium]|jgi:type III secretion protein N (ATPase)